MGEKTTKEQPEQETEAAEAKAAEAKAAEEVAEKRPTLAEFAGSPGGSFAAYGSFGPRGVFKIAGREVAPTGWNERSIRGIVPGDIAPGPTTIEVNGTEFKVKVA